MSRRFLFVGRALLVLFLFVPGLLAAQENTLDRVEQLMAEGRFVSARDTLQGWLDTSRSTADRDDRQRGTWLRAVLTIDPEMAELDLRRLVVEYPGGAFSDRALLRLAQGAIARAEEDRGLEYLELLLRDYPQSPLRDEARSLSATIREALDVSSN